MRAAPRHGSLARLPSWTVFRAGLCLVMLSMRPELSAGRAERRAGGRAQA